MELTKEYLDQKLDTLGEKIDQKFAEEREYVDQKFAEERTASDEKFDELVRTVAVGFEGMVTKEEFYEFTKKVNGALEEMRFQIAQLASTVKQFVEQIQKHDLEIVGLRIKCSELEARLSKLEQHVT